MTRKLLYSSLIVVLILAFAVPVMAQTEVTEVGMVGTINSGVDFTLVVSDTVSYTVVPADLTVLDTLAVDDFVKVTGDLTDVTISNATVVVGVAGTWTGSVESVDPFMLLVESMSYNVIPLFDYDPSALNVGDVLEVSGWLIEGVIYSEIYANSIETIAVPIEIQGEVTALDPLMVMAEGLEYTVFPNGVDTSLVQVGSQVWVFGMLEVGTTNITADRILVMVEYVGTVLAEGDPFSFMTKGGMTLHVTSTADYTAMEGDTLIVIGWQEGTDLIATSIEVLFKGDGSDLIKQGHFCTDLGDSHPVAERLAEEYGVYYEEVMSWFCVGNFGFGEIKNAFKANMKLGEEYSAEEILAMKEELGGWGNVKQELGLIGKDKNKPDDETANGLENKNDKPDKPDKPEKPENPGNSDKDKETGPPEHANNDKDKDKDK